MHIIIPGNPIAKKRPRFARRGNFVSTYNEQETEEGRFFLQAQQQAKSRVDGPVAVIMRFFMKRPKNHYGTGRNAGKLKPSAPRYHTSKPDLDNLEKFANDCLNKVVWRDDAQIVSCRSEKVYADDGEVRTEIQITEISSSAK